MAQRKSLGKGLGALLPQDRRDPEELPINEIAPNPDQPRKEFSESSLRELAQSIENHGIIQPILVKKHGEQNIIVAGERRWRAAAIAGLERIPVRFFHGDDENILQISLIENLQREDLSPLEIATTLQEIMRELSITQEEIASKVGWSRSSVANKVRLLRLPDASMELLRQGRISEGHARLLLSIDDEASMDRTATKCAERGWSVKQLEAYLKPPSEDSPRTVASKTTPPWGSLFEKNRIVVDQTKRRGKVKITLSGLTEEQAQIIGDILSQGGERLFPGK